MDNLPYGIVKVREKSPRVCTIIGHQVIDLAVLSGMGYFDDMWIDKTVFESDSLNHFISLGKTAWQKVRNRLLTLFSADNGEIRDNPDAKSRVFHDVGKVQMCLPVKVGDYTDFYSSMEHATNVGTMFRGKDNALMPNWKHLPVGYHGRASSIVVSGIDIRRPCGQFLPKNATAPVFGPSHRLDFELEMAFITTNGNPLGHKINTAETEDYIFGLVLFNDWSARDIQQWEYQPLGPFLGKSFASSVSPWIVPLDALKPFRVQGPEQIPSPQPYLQFEGKKNFDINLEVHIQPENSAPLCVCRTNCKYLYWNICQQLAHQTVNGCNVRAGDLYASGTISGPVSGSFGSMLELSWNGTKTLKMPDGSERSFIEDGDTVIMKGYAEKNGLKIGFGELQNKVLPALV